MLHTPAIVLRKVKYGESSLILDMLTRASGRKSFIIGGVRKAGAKTPASLLELMSLIEIVAYDRPDRELNRLKEVSPAYVYQALPFHLPKGTTGLFMCELIEKTVREREANPALFDFIFETYVTLDQTDEKLRFFPIRFMLQLSKFLGIRPSLPESVEQKWFDLKEGQFVLQPPTHPLHLNEELSLALQALLGDQEPHCTQQQRWILLEKVIDYFRLHIEGFHGLNSHEVLHQVLH